MRQLTAKQKKLLNKWKSENNKLTMLEDLSMEQIWILKEINDTEILPQEVSRYLRDLYFEQDKE